MTTATTSLAIPTTTASPTSLTPPITAAPSTPGTRATPAVTTSITTTTPPISSTSPTATTTSTTTPTTVKLAPTATAAPTATLSTPSARSPPVSSSSTVTTTAARPSSAAPSTLIATSAPPSAPATTTSSTQAASVNKNVSQLNVKEKEGTAVTAAMTSASPVPPLPVSTGASVTVAAPSGPAAAATRPGLVGQRTQENKLSQPSQPVPIQRRPMEPSPELKAAEQTVASQERAMLLLFQQYLWHPQATKPVLSGIPPAPTSTADRAVVDRFADAMEAFLRKASASLKSAAAH